MWGSVGQLELTDRTLCGPDSRVIPTVVKFLSTFKRGQRPAEGEVYVVKTLTNSLLSRPTMHLMEVIAKVNHSLKDQYPSLFRGLPHRTPR